jgi:ribosomal protein S18 acetylase RimI-like enzyme
MRENEMAATHAERLQRVVYAAEPGLPVGEFRQLLADSGLGTIRPVDDEARLAAMLARADLLLTARTPGGELLGLLRCLTDFHWCCFVPELAVGRAAQGLGVGRGLLDELRRSVGPRVAINLVSVPTAVGFYERAGLARTLDAFMLARTQ